MSQIASQSFTSLPPELHVLPNGLQVLVQEDDRHPLVVMRLYVRAGSAYEQTSESGISHLIEHMAFKGADGQERGRAAETIEGAGGSLNAATGFDQTVYMVDLPADHWHLGLTTLYELCFGPPPGPEELELEKNVILAEMAKNQDNPRHCLFEQMQGIVWKGTGYERPIIGTRETLLGLSSEAILDYVRRTYLPQSMLLVVCGQVRSQEIVKAARELFIRAGTKVTGRHPACSFSRTPSSVPELQLVPTKWKKAYAAFGFPAPPFSDFDSVPLELACYILGGDTSSRWYAGYRFEKELVDQFGISPILLEQGGMIFVNVQLDPGKVRPFCREWRRDIIRLQDAAVRSSELERAKVNLEDALLQSKETLAGLASKIGHFQFFEKSVQTEERYLDQIRRATTEDVHKALSDYLQLDRMQAVFLLPEDCEIDEADLEGALGLPRPGPADRAGPVRLKAKNQPSVQDLGQGCRLVLLPDDSLPYTALDLTWLGGDQLLGETEQGLAALTARSLIKGAGSRDAQQIRELLSKRAGYLQGLANRDQMSILAKFPTRFSAEILEVLEDMIQQPVFAPREVGLCAADQVSRIIERCDHPLGLLSREIFPFLFSGHAYGYYHLGEPDAVEGFQPEDLQRFWSLQRACPWVLSVCGHFEQERIEATARQLLHRAGHQPCTWSAPKWSPVKQLELEMQDRNQAHLLLVFPVPGLGSSQDAGIALTKKILAGQDGLLFKELRDRQGLGYAVSPLLSTNPGVGFLGFYIGTSADTVDQAVDAFQEVILRLQDHPVDSERLDRARNLLQAEFYRERQGLLSRCSEASDLQIYDLPLEYYQEMIHKAQTLTPKAVQDFIRSFLQWDERYTMVLRTRTTG
ncbi:MAG: insulinase family protein [Desulfohalobiaceae bacterium]|nr:insulinase family protein [Desulfohalobiaceae bacterium]